MSNFHQLVLINGMATSGKSTFAQFCIDYAKRKYGVNGEELSTVDWVKEVARFCGWDGKKTELDRRFLSDLKFALERWDGSPVTSVLDKLKKHPEDESWISFVNCREPRNIDEFIQLNMETTGWPCVTVFVQNDRAPKITSNPADAGVFNYNYDIYINNNSDLIALRQEAERFVDELWGEFCERE